MLTNRSLTQVLSKDSTFFYFSIFRRTAVRKFPGLRLPEKTLFMSLRIKTILSWVFRVVAAVILLQTLFFKFTGAEESVYIFSKLGIEPWGRIGSGVMELIASVLILFPAPQHWALF
jgi:hypothetical protein